MFTFYYHFLQFPLPRDLGHIVLGQIEKERVNSRGKLGVLLLYRKQSSHDDFLFLFDESLQSAKCDGFAAAD